MPAQAQCPCSCAPVHLLPLSFRTPSKVAVSFPPEAPQCISGFNGASVSRKRRNARVAVSAAKDETSNLNSQKKRKIVEHICLLGTKEDISEEEEKELLDYMYTTQYQMGGIVSISLGRITIQNPEQRYTYAVYIRFQTRDHLMNFYKNPLYLGVLKEHVMPHCHVRTDMN